MYGNLILERILEGFLNFILIRVKKEYGRGYNLLIHLLIKSI
jgi:hypothetical protein